jgi:hypothetical protein
MSDHPGSTTASDPAPLTPEQAAHLATVLAALGDRPDRLRTLVELADSIEASQRVWRFLRRFGLTATGVLVILYYLLALRNGWHPAPRQ